jgi:hypothetical protein
VGTTLHILLGTLFCGLDVRHGLELLLPACRPAGTTGLRLIRLKEPRILAMRPPKVKFEGGNRPKTV